MREPERFDPLVVSFCEFGLGGDPGLPDTWIAWDHKWNPMELKRGTGVAKQLRPSRVRWHKGSISLGIPTYGMVINNPGTIVTLCRIIRSGRPLVDNVLAEIPVDMLSYQTITQYLV